MSACAVFLSVGLLLGPAVPSPPEKSRFAPPAPGRYAGYARTAQSSASELLFRREAARAQQRAARIEARRWQGRSALRPTIAPRPSLLFEPSPPAYPVWGPGPLRVSFNFPLW